MPIKSRVGYAEGDRSTLGGPEHVKVVSSYNYLHQSVNSPTTDNPFASEGFSATGALLSGSLGYVYEFNGTPSALYSGVESSMKHFMEVPNANASTLLARTNPARPNVLLPVFGIELKDMPDMLRQVGRIAKRIHFEKGHWRSLIRPGHINKDMSAANLAIQFGWLPFVNDLWSIISFQDAMEKRRKELEKLAAGKGRSSSTSFGSVGYSYRTSMPANTDWGAYISTFVDISYQAEAWGTVKWIPSYDGSIPTSDVALRRLVTGLTPGQILNNVWEALPWSWLIDYFVNVGNIITAGNRTIATPASACIMWRRTTSAKSEGKIVPQNPANPCVLGAGKYSWYAHRRDVAGGFSQMASYPTLGARQLSILGSLAILRAR